MREERLDRRRFEGHELEPAPEEEEEHQPVAENARADGLERADGGSAHRSPAMTLRGARYVR